MSIWAAMRAAEGELRRAIAEIDGPPTLAHICPQCGEPYWRRACGPTHAIVQSEANLRAVPGDEPDGTYPGSLYACCEGYPHYCPGCGRIMSHREAAEQAACNDCAGQ